MTREPVLTAAAVSGAVVALAAVFGVVLDVGVAETLVATVLPLVAALIARSRVTPVS